MSLQHEPGTPAPRAFTCLACRESFPKGEPYGQTLRLYQLCLQCVKKGRKLYLATPEPLQSSNRKWYVQVR